MTTSILPPEMTGIMTITGIRGVGKTLLAVSADAPENIAFFDFEQKGEGFDSQVHFGLYRALTEEAKVGNPADLYDISMKAFETLPQNKFTVAILDNISPLELAMNAEAIRDLPRYCREYGLNLKNAIAGRMGGTHAVANFMISTRISKVLHSRGVRLIIVTSHVGARWGAGAPIAGKLRVKGADRWQELSILSLVLVRGDYPPVPSAIVQKEQLALLQWDAEKMEHTIRRRLPFRIPRCTFAEIRRYLREPADLDQPAPGETLIAQEWEPYDDALSKEQIALMRLGLEQQQREERGDDQMLGIMAKPMPKPVEVPDLDDDMQAQLVQLVDSGAKPADIAQKLGVTVPQAVKLMKGI